MAQIAGLYATGLTMAQIAARYGVSRDTIRARLLAAGVTLRRAPPRPRGQADSRVRSLDAALAVGGVSAFGVREALKLHAAGTRWWR
jgi:hypothetical protein